MGKKKKAREKRAEKGGRKEKHRPTRPDKERSNRYILYCRNLAHCRVTGKEEENHRVGSWGRGKTGTI